MSQNIVQTEIERGTSNVKEAISRGEIIVELLKRRTAQDKRWGGAKHDDTHDELDWQEFVRKQVDDAENADTSEQWRDRMLDIGALALAAIEWADRKDREQS